MTSTSTCQGLQTESKPSSRVLRPPGGASSNIFGGYEDTSPQPVKKQPEPVVVEAPPPDVSAASDDSEPSEDSSKVAAETTPAESSSPRESNSSYKKRGLFNPITGIVYPGNEHLDHQEVRHCRKRDSTHNPINWSPIKTTNNDDGDDQYKPSKRFYGQEKDSAHNPINWSSTNTAAPTDTSGDDADRFKPSKRYYSQDKETYNPITGELVGSGDTKNVHTSTKVHHPPGGKSTGLW